MIKGAATIEFGNGSTASLAGIDDQGVGVIFMRSTSPGKVGDTTRFNEVDWKMVQNDPEVIMFFTNVESVDNLIHELTHIKKLMLEDLNEEEEESE